MVVTPRFLFEEGGTMFLHNFGTYLHDYIMLQPKRSQSEFEGYMSSI
jgi:hypothetical protein